jgi:outer membrane protein
VKSATIVALVAAATVTLAVPAAAEENRWIGRVRGLGVVPDYNSDEIGATGTRIKVGSTFGGELSVTYLLNPHWGLELSAAAMPLRLTTVGGEFPGLDAGKVDLVCGLLSLEYHFETTGRIKPYLGVGMALARPVGYALSADMQASSITDLTFTSSLRMHTQLGADLQIGDGWRLNLDLRYVPVTTRVDFRLAGGGSLDTIALDVNPIIAAIGIGRSF